jgi:hypothetical protein
MKGDGTRGMKLTKVEMKYLSDNTPIMLVLTIDGEEIIPDPQPKPDLLNKGYIWVGKDNKIGTTITVTTPDGDEKTFDGFFYHPKLTQFIYDVYLSPEAGPFEPREIEFESIFPGGEL